MDVLCGSVLVLQFVAVCCSHLKGIPEAISSWWKCICCSVLQCVAVCCSALVLQCVAVCSSQLKGITEAV